MKLANCNEHLGANDKSLSCWKLRHDDGRLVTALEMFEVVQERDELLGALKNVTMELRQLHAHHYPACGGGCPSDIYIARADALIAEVEA